MIQNDIKILMIDDDEEDFMIVRDIIKETVHHKYSIDWRSSFDSGLAAIAERKHDIYFVDYRLGAKNGLDLIRKAIEIGCEAPLIILTGENNFEIDRKAMEAGAADYMVKGTISGQILESSIRYAISNANHRKEMNELNAALEKRVKSRTTILEETLNKLETSQNELIEAKNKAELAAKIAEEASKAKSHFLSNMSHEIRTPMNAIIGFTKIVLGTDLSEKQREYINAIKVSGDILIVLINDILDLAKVEAGKMTFERSPFSLVDSVSEMLQLFQTKIKEQNLKLVKDYDSRIPKVVMGDSVRLNQIILNLVSNAVKFTKKGQITVGIHLLEESTDKVTIEFSVTDTGIGISEAEQKTIFDKFQQAAGANPIYGGTGLGLAISKQLVEHQGGGIAVKSESNVGSTFSFTLSFDKTDQEAKSVQDNKITYALPDPSTKTIKILVAEDVLANQFLIKTLLGKYGFETDIAGNGRIAIEKVKKHKYDIVLMDLQMPERNGFEVTDYIRNVQKSNVPVIALTADVTTVDVDKCREAGMNDYLSKPIDDKLLYNMIAKYTSQFVENESSEKKKYVKEQNNEKQKLTNSEYLLGLANGNTEALIEIVNAYLEETPQLVNKMKQSIQNSDWDGIRIAAHSLIPCFSLMGIDSKYEAMSRTIEEYAHQKHNMKDIQKLTAEIDLVCKKACEEIKKEFVTVKS
ncbi:MAG: response regulator [Bacteroidota bacterium]